MNKMNHLNFFMIAGEMSGDILGASLMSGLITETKGKVAFSGVGASMLPWLTRLQFPQV